MSGLGFDKKLVDGKTVGLRKNIEVDAEFDHRKKVQGLLGTHRKGVAQDAIGAANLVVECDRFALGEKGAGVLLVLDDLLDDTVEAADDFLLGLAERGLVRDLKKIPHRLGSLTMESTNGESDFVHRVDDFIDLVTHHERRKVQHGRGAHAGANIRGAGGEITEVGIKSEIQRGLELAIHAVDHVEDIAKLEPAADRLHAEVVLLVDHDAEGLAGIRHHRAADGFGSVLAADEVTLDKDLFFQWRKGFQRLGIGLLHLGQSFHGGLH